MFEVPERFNVGTLVDRNLEAGRGDKVALRSEGAELTYAQLYDLVCRAGNALRALDRPAEGGRARPPRHPVHLRDLRAGGARDRLRRRHALDDQALPRVRSR